nr:tyrosine-type recombinase/integrase [uncultured Acetatifactor sp.]
MSTTQPIKNPKQLATFKNYYLQERPNPRNHMLIIIGLNSALRISDILGLTYGDLYHFQHRTWKSHIVLREQKTGKTNRIYINREIREILKLYVNIEEKTPASWLFVSQIQKTKPLSRFQAYRIVKEAAAFAGMDANISCHSLRKTFGYHAWKQGTPPALLMSIYNHSAYGITKRYLCIDQDDKDEVFAKIKI